jgi:hypothetical protein
MAQSKSSAYAHPPTRREGRRCEVCGVSSHEKSLVGTAAELSLAGRT